MTSTSLLAGLRVVDLTDLRGALAGRLLGDLGASVVRVSSPCLDRGDDTDAAKRFRQVNKSVAPIDILEPAGRRRLDELLSRADVLIDNLGPNLRRHLGLQPGDVAERYPALVHVAVTDLGLEGPRADWTLDPLPAFASSGAHFSSGFPDKPPCAMRGYTAHDCGAVFAALAAVAGVAHRHVTTLGQSFDVSVQEAALSGLVPWSIPVADYQHINPHLPIAGYRNAEGAHNVLPAADGYVRVMTSSLIHWRGFLQLCGNPDGFEAETWRDPIFRRENADVIKAVAAGFLQDRTRAELVDQAVPAGATIGAVMRPSEFAHHPQIRHRRFFADLDGDLVAAAPWTIEGARPSVTGAQRALEWTGPSSWAPPPDPAAEPGLLLAGVRVVEFGVGAVAPECAYVLSELGADVLKVESSVRPDALRLREAGKPNASYVYNTECRGRRNVAIDLTTDEGRALALRLCAQADVVLENYRGGTMEKLGLGSDDVRALNPAIIYGSSQGFGRGGPMGAAPAWGQLNSCFSGAHYLWNHPESEYPCGTSVNHPDHIAGKWLALVVLAALERRARTGEGADVEIAQTECAAYMMGDIFVELSRTGEEPQPLGNRSLVACPHDVYPAAGEDRWLAVSCADTASFRRLGAVIGLPVKERWASLDGRLADREFIDRAIGAWTSPRQPDRAAEELQAASVSAMPVMGGLDLRADAHLAARGAIVAIDNPFVGVEHHASNPIRPSRLPLRVAGPAPAIGQHTHDVLTEVLGMSTAEVDKLVERGVCR